MPSARVIDACGQQRVSLRAAPDGLMGSAGGQFILRDLVAHAMCWRLYRPLALGLVGVLLLGARPALAQGSSGAQVPASSAGLALAPTAGQEAAADAANTSRGRSAKESGTQRALTVTPTFDSILSYVQTSGRLGQSGYGDFVTQLRPGLQITARTGRVRGTLIYYLDANRHTHNTSNATLQNSLNANGSAEIIQNWFFVDGRANISQQARSAFGQQTVAGSQSSGNNQTEVGTLYVSPYVKGVVPDIARYEARFITEATNARRSVIGDSTNNTASLSLNSPNSGARFGWGAQATKRQTSYRAGRTTDEDRAFVSAVARPDTDLTVTLRAGREAQNVANLDRRADNNFGAGLSWTPSNRTSASIDADRRYFGQSYRVLLDHRLSQSSFRLSATRDVSNNTSSSGSNSSGGAATAFELQFRNLTNQFPDPKQRAEVALALLQGRGQDPNAVFSNSYLASGLTLVQRLDLSWIYTGRRQTFSLLAFTSETNTLGVLAPGATNLNDVRQSGLSGTASHRLTPTANVSLTGSFLHTAGTQGFGGTDLKSMQLNWSDTINRYTTATLGARFSVFDSPTDPYREAALTATIGLRF
jgi:uncharacterized protein (PEP-CTERM system associated)